MFLVVGLMTFVDKRDVLEDYRYHIALEIV